MPLGPLFLSASVPDPRRDPRFFTTSNTVAIRDAVIGLVSAALPRTTLVFGGHPAITPIVKWVADQHGLFDRVRMFQSKLFRPLYIDDIAYFRYIEVDADESSGDPVIDRERSLLAMRRAMLASEQRFAAAFFIGGMEGILEEFRLVRELRYEVPCYPIASTGGAAAILWREFRNAAIARSDRSFLEAGENTAYVAVFTALLDRLERQ